MLGVFEFGISVFRDDVFEYYYQTFSYYHPQSVMLTSLSGPGNGDTLVSLQSTTNPFLYSTDLHCEFGTNLADAALTNLHVLTCLTPSFDLGQNKFVEIPAFLYRGGTECLNASGGTECLNAIPEFQLLRIRRCYTNGCAEGRPFIATYPLWWTAM